MRTTPFLVAVLVVLLTSCTADGAAEGEGEAGAVVLMPPRIDPALITDGDRSCDADEDCVIVDAECCTCRSSGNDAGRTSIREDAKVAVDERRIAICGERPCSAALSHDETCCAEHTAVCVDGRCEIEGIAGRNAIDDRDLCTTSFE